MNRAALKATILNHKITIRNLNSRLVALLHKIQKTKTLYTGAKAQLSEATKANDLEAKKSSGTATLRFKFELKQLTKARKELEGRIGNLKKAVHLLELKSITNKSGTLVYQPFAALKKLKA